VQPSPKITIRSQLVITADQPRTDPETVATTEIRNAELDDISESTEVVEDLEEEYVRTNPFLREDFLRHPLTRIAACILLIALEFCFCVENPVSRSHSEMNWAVVGPATNLLFRQWPMRKRLWLMATKVGMASGFCFAALVVARKFVHPFFAKKIGLSMFAGDRGDVFCTLLVGIPALYSGAVLYNMVVFILVPSDEQSQFFLTDSMSTSNAQYYSHRQSFDFIACFLTLVMVVDNVLQDRAHFIHWQEYRKHEWITDKQGFRRVLTVWLCSGGLALVGLWVGDVCFALRSDPADNLLATGLFGTDEVSQITLCSLLFACRVLVIIQDCHFPQFGHSEGTKIAGTIAEGRLTIYYIPGAKKLVEAAEAAAERAQQLAAGEAEPSHVGDDDGATPRLQQWWKHKHKMDIQEEEENGVVSGWTFQIHFDGKWLMYGPLLVMLCLDAHTLYQLLEYSPEEYGQYADPVEPRGGARSRLYSLVSYIYMLRRYYTICSLCDRLNNAIRSAQT
jgi:hypothetical protein